MTVCVKNDDDKDSEITRRKDIVEEKNDSCKIAT